MTALASITKVGHLVASPFPERLKSAASCTLSLSSESDFAVAAEFKGGSVPVLVDFSEYYDVLADIVNEIRRLFSDLPFIVIGLNLPGARRLPQTLLQSDVILVQDPYSMSRDLEVCGTSHVMLEIRTPRHVQEAGDNGVTLRFCGNLTQQPVFEELCSLLNRFSFRFEEVL